MRLLVSAALVALAVAGPAAAEEPALTVTTRGSPIAPDSDPTPAVYRLEEEDLERAGLGLAEALASAPGVQVRRGGGSADLASASLRGGSSAQTPIYLAGVRLNDDLTGSVDLSTLPLWMLERVLVYRGHAPSSADDLGLGGAILLSPRLPSRVEAQAALGLGSFGEREGRARLSFGDGEGTGASVGLRHRAADGDFPFLDDNGTRFDTRDDVERRRRGGDHRELDVWALGRARLAGGGSLLTFANTFDRGAGAPGLALFGAERARVAQRRLLGGASAVVPCGL
ncbi:MAG: TonB-dependent receptor, partial [Polyangiaceae bacterium]